VDSRSSNVSAASAAAAAAAALGAAAEQEQQNLPHVSVLLQEVLHNLNHMPIKVCAISCWGMMQSAVSSMLVAVSQQ
jgi:hypothetical protein